MSKNIKFINNFNCILAVHINMQVQHNSYKSTFAHNVVSVECDFEIF